MHLNLELSTEVHFEYQDLLFIAISSRAVSHQRANISIQALVRRLWPRRATRLPIAEYTKVSPRDGRMVRTRIYNIGVCHYELWQTDEAITFYKRAIELKQGNYARASFALGVCARRSGKTN
jgi:hypothetical protein